MSIPIDDWKYFCTETDRPKGWYIDDMGRHIFLGDDTNGNWGPPPEGRFETSNWEVFYVPTDKNVSDYGHIMMASSYPAINSKCAVDLTIEPFTGMFENLWYTTAWAYPHIAWRPVVIFHYDNPATIHIFYMENNHIVLPDEVQPGARKMTNRRKWLRNARAQKRTAIQPINVEPLQRPVDEWEVLSITDAAGSSRSHPYSGQRLTTRTSSPADSETRPDRT